MIPPSLSSMQYSCKAGCKLITHTEFLSQSLHCLDHARFIVLTAWQLQDQNVYLDQSTWHTSQPFTDVSTLGVAIDVVPGTKRVAEINTVLLVAPVIWLLVAPVSVCHNAFIRPYKLSFHLQRMWQWRCQFRRWIEKTDQSPVFGVGKYVTAGCEQQERKMLVYRSWQHVDKARRKKMLDY